MIRLNKITNLVFYCLALYACTISLQAQNKIYELVTHNNTMQLEVPPLTVYDNNYSSQCSMSPILTVNRDKNSQKVWGTKYQGIINGYSDVWYSCSYMSYVNDGKWLLTVDGANYESNPQRYVRIYDIATMQEIKTLPIQGKYYVTKDTKKVLIIQSKQTNSQVLELDLMSGNTTSLISVDYQIISIHYPQTSETWIVNGLKNNEYNVYVYKKSSNEEVFRIFEKEFYETVNSFRCDVSEDGEIIVGLVDESSNSMKFVGYSLRNRKKIFTYTPTIDNLGDSFASDPKISPDGKSFVIVHGNNLIHFLTDGTKIKSIPIQLFTPSSTSAYQIRWLKDNKSVVMATLYDISEVDLVTNIIKDAYISTPINNMVFLQDKKHVVFTSLNSISCINFEQQGVVWKRNFIEPTINIPFDIYNQSRKMVLYRPGYMYIIDLYTGAELEEISVPYDDISMVRFSVSGNKVILGQEKNFQDIFVYDFLTKNFSTISLMNASPSPVHMYFDDVITKRIIKINEFGSFVFDLEGKLTDVLSFSPSLPRWDNKESKRTSGLGYGYGKIFSDDGKYIIGLRSLYNSMEYELFCASLQDTKNLYTLKTDNNSELFYITLTDKDKYIRAFASDSNIYTWEIVTGKFISKERLAYPLGNNKFGACAYISPYDPTIVAVIADTSRVIIYQSEQISSIQESKETRSERSRSLLYVFPSIVVNQGELVTIDKPSQKIHSISILTATGKYIKVPYSYYDAEVTQIHLPSLPCGIYFVQVALTNGEVVSQKLIIQ